MGKKLIVFGGSGHAKDVIHIARSIGYQQFLIVTTNGSCEISDCTAINEAAFSPENYQDYDCFVAIGNNAHRQRFLEHYTSLNFINIISPTADISDSSTIGTACYIGSGCYIGPNASLQTGSIVNTHSIVGHDSSVGHYSQIGPKVCISGNVKIGRSVFVGAGTIFNNGSPEAPLIIPDTVEIGMGCHITSSIKHEGLKIIPKPNHIGIRPEA